MWVGAVALPIQPRHVVFGLRILTHTQGAMKRVAQSVTLKAQGISQGTDHHLAQSTQRHSLVIYRARNQGATWSNLRSAEQHRDHRSVGPEASRSQASVNPPPPKSTPVQSNPIQPTPTQSSPAQPSQASTHLPRETARTICMHACMHVHVYSALTSHKETARTSPRCRPFLTASLAASGTPVCTHAHVYASV